VNPIGFITPPSVSVALRSGSATETIGGDAPSIVFVTKPIVSTLKTNGEKTMATFIRVMLGFQRLSDSQIISLAGAVLKGLPAFTNPPVDLLKLLETALDELNAAIAAQAHGGAAATAEKNNKREAVIALLRQLAHYAQDNCGNDRAKLLSSGFQLASDVRATAPLDDASIQLIERGVAAELVLRLKPVPRARCYQVRAAEVENGKTSDSVMDCGLFTKSRISVKGLTPGKTYSFQVRAVGGAAGYSDWSNPVSCMCA
jgi:hypothetical protein